MINCMEAVECGVVNNRNVSKTLLLGLGTVYMCSWVCTGLVHISCIEFIEIAECVIFLP